MTVSQLNLESPLLVLFGNESEGLKSETVQACDDVFRLPMYGFTESFNISVSVGMTLADLVSRLRGQWAQEGIVGDMPKERQRYLMASVVHEERAGCPAHRQKRTELDGARSRYGDQRVGNGEESS